MASVPKTANEAESDEFDDSFLSPEGGRRRFEEAVRARMGISGEEFIRRYEAGEYCEIADRDRYWHIGHLIGLIASARDLRTVAHPDCSDPKDCQIAAPLNQGRTMSAPLPEHETDEARTSEPVEDPPVIFVSPEEGRRMFDEAAREWVGMSGEEFLRRYDAGEFENIPDDEAHRRYIDLVILRHFGRQDG